MALLKSRAIRETNIPEYSVSLLQSQSSEPPFLWGCCLPGRLWALKQASTEPWSSFTTLLSLSPHPSLTAALPIHLKGSD